MEIIAKKRIQHDLYASVSRFEAFLRISEHSVDCEDFEIIKKMLPKIKTETVKMRSLLDGLLDQETEGKKQGEHKP